MKEDIKLMREAGFQFLRVAAIGNVTLDENDQVKVDTPFVDEMLNQGRLQVSVLPTKAAWFGVTYKEDRDQVAKALRTLHDRGIY